MPPPGYTAIVVGAGASGMAMAVELEKAGIDYTIIEKADAVGGTWWHNRYPGCGVDTPSHLYCFSFFDEYDWPAYFSLRDTLHDYFETVADRARHPAPRPAADGGRRGPLLRGRPGVGRRRAHGRRARPRRCAPTPSSARSARSGARSCPICPASTRSRASGPTPPAGPTGLDLAGKRVGVIGNGASAMQLVPAIVDEAEHVYVFTRSAQWAAPFEKFHLQVPEALRWLFREVRLYRLWYRLRLFWNFNDKNHKALQRDPDWEHPERALNRQNDYHREYFTQYILEELGDRKDELAPHVLPAYPPFGKRMLMDNGWFRTLTRDDITLNPTGAAAIRPHAIVAGDGQEHEVDVLVLATGFDVVRFLAPMELVGRSGRTIRETWEDDDARAYLGTVVPDLPNFFCLYGPNLQGGHGGSLLTTLEVQARYVRKTLQEMFRRGLGSVECRPEVNDAYNERIDAAHENMVVDAPGDVDVLPQQPRSGRRQQPVAQRRLLALRPRPDLDEFIVEPRQPVPVAGT